MTFTTVPTFHLSGLWLACHLLSLSCSVHDHVESEEHSPQSPHSRFVVCLLPSFTSLNSLFLFINDIHHSPRTHGLWLVCRHVHSYIHHSPHIIIIVVCGSLVSFALDLPSQCNNTSDSFLCHSSATHPPQSPHKWFVVSLCSPSSITHIHHSLHTGGLWLVYAVSNLMI